MAEIQTHEGATAAVTTGSAGLQTQVPGTATTVTAVADATGGVGAGNIIQSDLDEELYKFHSDDTPLMQLMLNAKKVKVSSPVVEHYMIDEPRSSVTTAAKVTATTAVKQFELPLVAEDQSLPATSGTLLCQGVDGWAKDGKTKTPGKPLMLFVVSTSNANPTVIAVNGPKSKASDEFCTVPDIPAGTTCILLANALYETQKEVDPDLIVPQPTEIYLQKRGMNQIVSDYYEAQKKKIPFSQAVIAEAAIAKFKVSGNRTLYAGRKGKFKVKTDKVGFQDIYTTEGVRYQVKKTLDHTGKWDVEQIIALAKMVYTGEDVPKSVAALCGKNFLENIQCIDYSKHPEIQISSKTNPVGWVVTNFHTVFGDIEFKHDPTLDRLKWSNSAFIVAYDRLVHYQYSAEHSATDRIEGEEATRKSVVVWDALGLKGTCHVWVNGEGDSSAGAGGVVYIMWDSKNAPTTPVDGAVYYLISDCAGINTNAKAGQMWQYKAGSGGAAGTWSEYAGDIFAN